MSKLQTRRTVSLRGSTHARLRDYARQHGRSVSEIVEEALRPLLGTSRYEGRGSLVGATIAEIPAAPPVHRSPRNGGPTPPPPPRKGGTPQW